METYISYSSYNKNLATAHSPEALKLTCSGRTSKEGDLHQHQKIIKNLDWPKHVAESRTHVNNRHQRHDGPPSAGEREIATSACQQDGKEAEQENTISDARIWKPTRGPVSAQSSGLAVLAQSGLQHSCIMTFVNACPAQQPRHSESGAGSHRPLRVLNDGNNAMG